MWLGEVDTPLEDVKALLQTFDDGGDWTMAEQAATRPPRAPKPPRSNPQQSLF